MSYVTVPVKRYHPATKFVMDVIQKNCPGKAFVLGGFARYLCSPHSDTPRPGDIDIFCSKDWACRKIVEYLESCGGVITAETSRAYTFGPSVFLTELPIQVIKPRRTAPGVIGSRNLSDEEIMDQFDFGICQAAVLSESECRVSTNFVMDEASKLLCIENTPCPFSTMARAVKYGSYGYTMPQGEAERIVRRARRAPRVTPGGAYSGTPSLSNLLGVQ